MSPTPSRNVPVIRSCSSIALGFHDLLANVQRFVADRGPCYLGVAGVSGDDSDEELLPSFHAEKMAYLGVRDRNLAFVCGILRRERSLSLSGLLMPRFDKTPADFFTYFTTADGSIGGGIDTANPPEEIREEMREKLEEIDKMGRFMSFLPAWADSNLRKDVLGRITALNMIAGGWGQLVGPCLIRLDIPVEVSARFSALKPMADAGCTVGILGFESLEYRRDVPADQNRAESAHNLSAVVGTLPEKERANINVAQVNNEEALSRRVLESIIDKQRDFN